MAIFAYVKYLWDIHGIFPQGKSSWLIIIQNVVLINFFLFHNFEPSFAYIALFVLHHHQPTKDLTQTKSIVWLWFGNVFNMVGLWIVEFLLFIKSISIKCRSTRYHWERFKIHYALCQHELCYLIKDLKCSFGKLCKLCQHSVNFEIKKYLIWLG